MFTESNILIYRCVTPLHCGAIEAGEGIDFSVAREQFTNFPIIPATSLKGVWRDICQRTEEWKDEVAAAFGSDSQEVGKNNSGLLGFVDAQILYLPVRLSVRTFFLITCPLQISRFNDAREKKGLSTYAIKEQCENDIIISETLCDISKIYLEDIKLNAKHKTLTLPTDGVPAHLTPRLALVSDNKFEWFASNAMAIHAHNKLSVTKKSENLWYEELVPAESIFFGQLLESPPYKAKEGDTAGKYSSKLITTAPPFFQIGRNYSTGHGLMQITVVTQDESYKDD
ncbi:type III-B CRISPR module RAMP protein Cmr4 [Desulfovibrio gilichinskyi]|uniref:CRISPR-associated protein, Cmr4 family n=1 Tax=Desulfovibrio gilichinskyi TaxID=1519643 RepID=A0A1X7F301_9BACT|nr:type III-B CRISPR module RAMP protein Cmr4 [Desulfovibrio gilichinskyi]SMF44372.1 CRISPR-associated protein, Cmr4 family [Desulfovibrio gilichinskyi]